MAKLTRQDIYDTAKELSNWGRWGDDDQISLVYVCVEGGDGQGLSVR